MMTRGPRVALAASLGLCVVLLARIGAGSTPPDQNRALSRTRINDALAMFAPSSDCLACHNNLVTDHGDDVSIGVSWRGTMMANAARDPYVRASVRREMIDHASRREDIDDECAACHAPAGQRMAHAVDRKGGVVSPPGRASGAHWSIQEAGRDGVTCTVCHQIGADRLGTPESYNGRFVVAPARPDGTRRAFGTFAPDVGRRRIMHSVTGFEQEQADHIQSSELCATCHTLITEALGADGQVIGSLPEQMNYQEWRHSAFVQEKRGCQSCHMPVARGPVRVASVLGEYRDRLARHLFVGGNAFMLRVMNRYRAELGVEATASELEATARATERQLEQETATVSIERATIDGNALTFDVVVRNLTGHKFPTGYPSRRAWLHVTVKDARGGTIFESGRLADTGLIEGNETDRSTEAFEPHYEQITEAGQVQVYESIMGTPGGEPTTGLLRATRYLKDNRLLPRGFDKRTATAEIAVIGGAAVDDDFIGGGDRVRYQIAGATVPATVEVELRYQPISYRWAQNLAGYDAIETRNFVSYYTTLAPSSSVLLVQVSTDVRP